MNQTPKFKKEFQKVINATQIREVSLVSSHCACHYYHSYINAKNTILTITQKNPNTKFTPKDKSSGIIFSEIGWTVEGKSQNNIKIKNKTIKKDELLFQISVSFMVIYDVSGKNLDPKAIKYFGEENASFNVYPYLREFTTNIGQRMNLPSPLVLPLLKPATQITRNNSKKKSKSSQQKSRESSPTKNRQS